MNDSTNIKYTKVTNAVQNINTKKKELQDILANFETIMNQTANTEVLSGQAGTELKLKFSQLKKKFDAYIATVTQFESMITFAKEETEGTEAAIKHAASDLAS